MNLRHLEIFCTVVECESFSRAAEQLIMTQPAVSMHVQAVERHFGIQLLERRHRRTILTEAGRAVHRWAVEALKTEAETRRIVDELKHVEWGRVVVGASMSVGSYLLPPILSRFKRAHPGAEIVVRLGDRDEVCADVLAGRVDCAVLIAREIPPGLEVEVVGTDEMVIICALSHRLAHRKRVSMSELAHEAFILAPRGSSYRKVIDDLLAEHGLKNLRVAMELDGSEGLKRGVQQGLGLGVALRSGLEWELEHGVVAEVAVADARLQVEMGLIYHPTQRESPMVQGFREYLSTQLQDHLAQPNLEVGENGRVGRSQQPAGTALGRLPNPR